MIKKSLLITLLMVCLAPWAMGQSITYTKVTENKTDWSGKYIFANTDASKGASSTINSSGYLASLVDLTISGVNITNTNGAAIFEIQKITGSSYYLIYVDGKGYLRNNSDKLAWYNYTYGGESYLQWEITFNNNAFTIQNKTTSSVTKRYLIYQSQYVDFELNASATGTNRVPIEFYEEIEITGCPKPSVTASNVGGRTATISWTYPGTDNYTDFEYICSETPITDFTGVTGTAVTGTSKELTGLTPETPYFCYVRTVCDASNDEYSDWSSACTFTTQVACPVPTGLTCTGYTATTATLEWTSTGAESYEIYLTTDENDEPTPSSTTEITSSTNSKTLENLTAETPYYAYVRGNCGTTDGESGWSTVCSFTPSAAVDITVYDKTNTNGYIPFHGSYADYGTRGQFVIPATALMSEGMESGATIQKLYFYTSTSSTTYNEEFTVYLKEVSYTTFANAALEDWSSMTAVWTNTLTISDNQLVIDFSNSPYTYHGGNLMIGFQVTTWASTCPGVNWYGENQSSGTYTAAYNDANSSHVWSSTISRQAFIPKTTINYIPGVEDPCHAPKDLKAENITSSQADLTWTKSVSTTTCTLRYHAKINGTWGEWITKNDVADPYTSYTLTGLNANTQYEYQVMGACGEGDTDWSISYAFTTDCGTTVVTPDSPFQTEGFENTSLPTCWNGNWKTTTNYHHNGSRAAYSDSDDNVDMYTPSIRINAAAAELKFWSYTYYPNNYGKNSVLVSTDNGTTFTEIWTPESVSASWNDVSIFIPSDYLNTEIIIAFRYEYNTAVSEFSRHSWFIDDLSIIAYDKVFNKITDNGLWTESANWAPAGEPANNQSAFINGAATIPSGCEATAKSITIGTNGSITIADGGQLVYDNSIEVKMQKTVTAYTDADHADWYTLSTPVHTGNNAYVTFTSNNETSNVVNIANATHNVYYLDEANNLWVNNLSSPGFSRLDNGRGYLYRRAEGATLEFKGNTNVGVVEASLTYTENAIQGFNLLGNPFTHNITWSNLTVSTGVYTDGYYLLNTDGGWSAEPSTSAVIAPMTAFLVQASAPGATIAMSNIVPAPVPNEGKGLNYANDNIMFTVKNSEYSDEAYVLFKEGHGLNKVEHRNAEIPMLYVINNGEKFAIADMSDLTKAIELGFEAKTMGQYTISLKAEGQYSYMHLIDKLTGNDIDMLVEDSYTFIGSQNDRNDRFVLSLNYNAANIDTESAIFAYQNGSEIIVNGEGELQVFDVTGRKVMTTTINGVQTINAMPQGVYIFRLNEKVQKIVVR